MCVRELVVVFFCIYFLKTGVQACPQHCVCTDGTTCSDCHMWYIFKVEGGVANCNSYIADVHFVQRPDLSASTVRPDRLAILFLRRDLNISTDALDYYYYTLQARESTSHLSYENTGSFVKHYNSGSPTSIEITSGMLKSDTAYDLRVALYKRVELKGWEQFTDYSNSITMTTTALSWVRKGGYEYMFSYDNALAESTFEDASAYCQLQGNHLASVTSYEEYQFLVDETSSLYTWIGFHIPEEISDTSDCYYCDDCNTSEDKTSSVYCTRCVSCRALWQWTDGSVVTYTFWQSTEPRYSYRCVVGYRRHDYWRQRSCSNTEDFVCKREAKFVPTTTTTTTTTTTIATTTTTRASTNPPICKENCECDHDNPCTACEKWYIYSTSGNDGRCTDYLEKITLPASANVSQGTTSLTSISVSFQRVDLPIPPYGHDYYYYSLQYRLYGETNDTYQNVGSLQQHQNSGNPMWITFSVSGLQPDTEYSVRVALYRRVEYRGWLDVSDATQSVAMRTSGYGWITFGEYEYMFSSRNSVPRMTFSGASAFCQMKDSNLTSILTYDENQFIRSYNTYTYTWIGFYLPETVEPVGCSSCDNCYYASNKNASDYCTQCIHCRSLWRWMDGSPVTSTFWDADEPRSNYKCASIYSGWWDDNYCGWTRYFICKRKGATLIDSKDDSNCSSNCLCEEGGRCVGCSVWHLYRIVEGQGNCDLQIDKIQLPSQAQLVVSNIGRTSVTVRFTMPTLNIPEETFDYYSYTLQYKLSSQSGDDYRNTGEFIHHYPELEWIRLTTSTFLPGTSYTVRVALYRRFEVKGWEELLDVTDAVTLTTFNPSWRTYGGYEYMFSVENNIQPMDFASSEDLCNENEAELVTVSNTFENEFIRNYTDSKNTWIGLHLPHSEDTDGCDSCSVCSNADNKNTSTDCVLCHHCRYKWVWTNGDRVQYSFWEETQPNEKGRCAYVYNKEWFDRPCSHTLYFCCKRESTGAGTTVPRTTPPVNGESVALGSDTTNSEGSHGSIIGIVAGLAVVVIVVVVVAVIILVLFFRKGGIPASAHSSDIRPPLELDSIEPQVAEAGNPYDKDGGNNNDAYENHHHIPPKPLKPPKPAVYDNQQNTYQSLHSTSKEGPSLYEPVHH